jgi:protein-tyrosine phosphatase
MAAKTKPIRVCFVCLGNICRSPTAEGVMQLLIDERGLGDQIQIDSAGTGAYHVGEASDPRSAAEAKRRGVILTSRARLFVAEDLDNFDYVVAMDGKNLAHMTRMAKSDAHRQKLSLLRNFASAGRDLDVPDPYYADNFDEVFDICMEGCRALLDQIVKTHGLRP